MDVGDSCKMLSRLNEQLCQRQPTKGHGPIGIPRIDIGFDAAEFVPVHVTASPSGVERLIT